MGFASICEIVEYSLDTIFKMNTQQGGLTDTMNDMIDALFGSIIMIVYYIKKYKHIITLYSLYITIIYIGYFILINLYFNLLSLSSRR